MADQDLHRVAFPTLEDVQVATLPSSARGGRCAVGEGAMAVQFVHEYLASG